MVWAGPEEAASPEKPQEVSFPGSVLLKDSITVFFSSKISVGFFFFAETCRLFFVSSVFVIASRSIFMMAVLKSFPDDCN